MSTDDIDGLTNFSYKEKDVVVPDEWKILPRQNWPKRVMAAMGISWNGTTPIYIVPSEVRLNAQAFIKLVLAPIVRYDFPRLYGSDLPHG